MSENTDLVSGRPLKKLKAVVEPVRDEPEVEEEKEVVEVTEEVQEELVIQEGEGEGEEEGEGEGEGEDHEDHEDLDVENGQANDFEPMEPLDPKLLEFEPYSPEEQQRLLKELRAHGSDFWIHQRVDEGVSPFKLLSLFQVDLADDPSLQDVGIAWFIVQKVARSVAKKRVKLDSVNTLEDAVRLIQKSSRIMVVTGAGISVSCGIPDFRSENGIYKRLHEEFNLPEPECMFDIEYFRDDPQPFFSFAKEIFPGNFKPSPSHYFIKMIEDRKKLLRNYTQNIDTLEQVANIKNVIQCHGSFATASCLACKHKVDCSVIRGDIFAQRIPCCTKCDDEDNIVKPDIVFFGEKLSDEFDNALLEDREKVDLLIVMGSSLKVAPVSSIMSFIPQGVPQILINREPISHLEFDIQLLGYCDTITRELIKLLGWEEPEAKSSSLDTLSSTSTQAQPTTTPTKSTEVQITSEDGSQRTFSVACEFIPPHQYIFEGGLLRQKKGAPGSKAESEDDEDDDGDDLVIEGLSDDEGSEDEDQQGNPEGEGDHGEGLDAENNEGR